MYNDSSAHKWNILQFLLIKENSYALFYSLYLSLDENAAPEYLYLSHLLPFEVQISKTYSDYYFGLRNLLSERSFPHLRIC
jgi:hypothetical protein